MKLNPNQALPHGLAALVMIGVLGLVAIDLWRSPSPKPLGASPAQAQPQPQPQPHQDVLAEIRQRVQRVDIDGGETKPAVYNYYVYKEVPFGKDGFSEVIVGMKFVDSNTTYPQRQFCYISTPSGRGTGRRIDLAFKNEGERVDLPISEAMVREGNTSAAIIEEAQALCAFM